LELNGAFLAGRPDLSAIEPPRELWLSISRRDGFPMTVAGVVAALLGRWSSLFEPSGLRRLILNARLGFSNLEHTSIPLHVVVTDIQRAAVAVVVVVVVVGSRGPAADALLASTAIPGIFPPVDIGSRALVDGGVLANVPLLEADALGAQRIYVLPTCAQRMPPAGDERPGLMQRALAMAWEPGYRRALHAVATRTDVRVLPGACGRCGGARCWTSSRRVVSSTTPTN
jgi:NTE family protein